MIKNPSNFFFFHDDRQSTHLFFRFLPKNCSNFCVTKFRICWLVKSGSWLYQYLNSSYDPSFLLCPGDVF